LLLFYSTLPSLAHRHGLHQVCRRWRRCGR
jgi:hypothetical protein